eukprot:TRINITY_DN5747_c0_g5_i1.p1 TRINITY_DN5747_c0_g5~~TRINITY_DN5747_c0_g5_i1.p1  ORF type:complete len:153 (-),score=27.02 TRINITY_DN5747_c0_g5_i1:591-1049(-)
MFIDLHGHVNRIGTFLYGNSIRGLQQVENVVFAKLLSLNSLNFEFDDCNFKESNMTAKDNLDGLTREGSSRVAIYKATQLPNCYTVEASFHGSRRLNSLPAKFNSLRNTVEAEDIFTNTQSRLYDGRPAVYSPLLYEDMGRVWVMLKLGNLF